jgi:uncharacterized protein YjbJ (UPF0337 family)
MASSLHPQDATNKSKGGFMLNEDQIKGKWKEFKGGVRNLWGEITDDELESSKGNVQSILGLIHQKYGETKEGVKEKMDSLLASFDNDTDKTNFSTDSYDRKPFHDRSELSSENSTNY